jgi:hypothetical protein
MPSQLGLVVAPSTLPAGTSRATYLRGAVASPICLSLAVFAGCVGLGYAGLLGAVIAVASVLGLGARAARYPSVRSYLEGQTRARANAKRECERLKRLRPTGPARVEHYYELRVLVEHIERLDPAEAQRFELQDLLDHFVDLVLGHHRCGDALRLAGAAALPATPITTVTRSRRRSDILQRRIRHRDECMHRMEQLADEIEATDELIRLVAQRVACPALDGELDREIDRRLWELDEVDAALTQLSA